MFILIKILAWHHSYKVSVKFPFSNKKKMFCTYWRRQKDQVLEFIFSLTHVPIRVFTNSCYKNLLGNGQGYFSWILPVKGRSSFVRGVILIVGCKTKNCFLSVSVYYTRKSFNSAKKFAQQWSTTITVTATTTTTTDVIWYFCFPLSLCCGTKKQRWFVNSHFSHVIVILLLCTV